MSDSPAPPPPDKTLIIGLAGTFAAGKDIGAEYLQETYGLAGVSTGDMVRKLARVKYDSVERRILHKTADETRKEKGAGVLVEEALRDYHQLHTDKPGVVISGIRSIGEAKMLLKLGGVLLFIDAPREVRFERSQGRDREGDEQTFEAFTEQEDKELAGVGDDEAVINIGAVRELADTIITNDGNLGRYFHQLEEALRNVT